MSVSRSACGEGFNPFASRFASTKRSIVVRVREYDEAFFRAVRPVEAVQRPSGMAALQEAFG